MIIILSSEVQTEIKNKAKIADFKKEFMYIGAAYENSGYYIVDDLFFDENDADEFYAKIDKRKILIGAKKSAISNKIPVIIHSHTERGIQKFSEQDNCYEQSLVNVINELFGINRVLSILFYRGGVEARMTTVDIVKNMEISL